MTIENDPIESAPPASRFVVGIDLGTTNSALAYVDSRDTSLTIRDFAMEQVVAPGVIEPRETLPSFHYQAAAGELAPGAFRLPWQSDDPQTCVGVWARDHGATAPGRQVASAKSWLAHGRVDRTADLLPWHASDDVDRLSPVEVSARYLLQMRLAWNKRHPAERLEQQDVALTLPASFDEVARELTIKAAARAGLPRVVLIEEPQAAFYAWIHRHADGWEHLIQPGETVLICDIGGGTSDFALVRAHSGGDTRVSFQRVAVGEHLILGGDNLDLFLARQLEPRFAARAGAASQSGQLEPRVWSMLVRACRQVKETLLGEPAPERMTVSLAASGSKLLSGAIRAEVSKAEVEAWLVDGFLPRTQFDDAPQNRRSGFQEFGLPYAADPAITRHLAAFLAAHGQAAHERGERDSARPDAVLFNGGFFASPVLRNRLLSVLGDWFSTSDQPWRPRLLDNDRLDLAVARGAAYYGLVRRGVGVKINAALARSYYLGVHAEGEARAVCLLPAGVEAGVPVVLQEPRFELLVRQPVEFPLFFSSRRLTDRPGQIVPIAPEEMTALPPIRTVLTTSGKKTAGSETLSVVPHAMLSEIGTLEMWCAAREGVGSWRMHFDIRAATQTDLGGHAGLAESAGIVDDETLEACASLICDTFGAAATNERGAAESLVKRLSARLDRPRLNWPPSLLRYLWQTLCDVESGRRKSPVHEARWLNLLGFALRPGYGMAVDDWRVAQTRRLLGGKLIHAGPVCRAEWWILWRRIAGGLIEGQQRSIAEPLLAAMRLVAKGRGEKPASHEGAELFRLLGSLELLASGAKIELGNLLLEQAAREKTASVAAAALWAVGRIGARAPLYGPVNNVLSIEVAETWIARILDLRNPPESAALALMQLARRTDDRYRDVGDTWRRPVIEWLTQGGAQAHFIDLVRQAGALGEGEQGLLFGESLPPGLRLASGD